MRRLTGGREVSPFAAGAIFIVLTVIALYFAFFRNVPFTGPFELRATFENSNTIQPNSPVRIAGVEAGKVKKVEPVEDSTASTVVMELKDSALPIREDARIKIRPRIFLEGNYIVDLEPGTPTASEVESGHTIPITQTAAPVQLDEVLTSLQKDSRSDLQRLLRGYGEALAGEPKAGEDSDQDPDTRGETAAQSLNDSFEYSAGALRGVSLVNQALLGTEPRDLSRLIASTQRVASTLNGREEQLKDLITNFNTTVAATASESENLQATIRELPQVLEQADPALDALNRSFPPTRAFAREILPGVRETAATIDASFPWMGQTRKLVSPAELQGLVRDLRPSIDELAQVVDDSVQLFPQVDLVSRCMTDVILPTGDLKIEDGFLSTGLENYKEFWQTMVGLSSESQNFDGNGGYTRFQPGGGDQTVTMPGNQATGTLFANVDAAPIGTRPAFPRRRPPYKDSEPCFRQRIPDLNSAPIGPGP